MRITDHDPQLALFTEPPSRRGAAVEAALCDLAERADARRLASAGLTPTELNVLLLREGVPRRSLATTAEAIRASGRSEVRRLHYLAANKLAAAEPFGEAA